jgi:formylglycine-generating enzyme required for sulfatase activity
MVEQRILGGRLIGVAVLVASFGFGAGCDDAKKGTVDAGPPKASAETAETPPPQPSASAAPFAVVGEMVRIPAGSFVMGSTDGQPDEKPARRVQVAAFEMDVTEVTLGAYQACVDSGKCTTPDLDHFCTWGRTGKENLPINCLDWDQATTYCASVKKRLPTEEEWEYAARGKDGKGFVWGTTPPPAGVCWAKPRTGTCPVESVLVDSPFGLRGMAGNVWEWTASGYSDDYSKPRTKERRVYRGGSFYEENPDHMRATTRNRRPTDPRLDYIGVRCAR